MDTATTSPHSRNKEPESSPAEENALSCSTCGDLRREVSIEKMDDLWKSADNGCEACSLLGAGLAAFFPSTQYITSVNIYISGDKRPLILNVYHGGSNMWADSGGLMGIEFYTVPRSPSKWPSIGLARHVSSHPFSAECVALTREWISKCTNNHPKCGPSNISSLLTRVVYVGSETVAPRLYATANGKEQYTALSWCWGKTVPLQTTTATLAKNQTSIPFASLPKTFQEAILVTRAIGVKYIWIDALCIIQDSKEDWNKEAAQMANIYQNALVTIAADSAKDSNEGCFVIGEARKMCQYTVSRICPGVSDVSSYVYVRHTTAKRESSTTWHSRGPTPAGANTLSSRAWALQEQLLSRRTLHFSSTELSWECAETVECECTSNQSLLERRRISMKKEYFKDHDLGSLDWEKAVEAFTKRDITVLTDRLPALSGLAAKKAQITNDSYFCGLWKSEIKSNLLWFVPYRFQRNMGSRNYSSRHASYYAPTWSWASVTGAIEFAGPNLASWEILEINCALAGPNPYGPAKSGYVRIRGMTVPTNATLIPDGELPRSLPSTYITSRSGKAHTRAFSDVVLTIGESFTGLILLAPLYGKGMCGLLLKESKEHSGMYKRAAYVTGQTMAGSKLLNSDWELWMAEAIENTITIV